jgi:hypothetical protein
MDDANRLFQGTKDAMQSGLVKTCTGDPAAAIRTVDASVVFVLLTWARQSDWGMVLKSSEMTTEKGPSQFAPFERTKGNPCRTAQLAFTAMHAATGHGVHHATDTIPGHDILVEEVNPKTKFLVPPKNLGGELSAHFNPIAAAIPVRNRGKYSVVYCVGAAALASYVSQLAGAGGIFIPATDEFYQSCGWYKRDFSYTGANRTDWWGDAPRVRQNSAPVLRCV